MATAQFYDKGQVDALLAAKASRASDPTAGNLAMLDSDGNPVDSHKSLDDISKEIQDAIEYAVVVDDGLVPTEGPGTSVIEAFQSGVATWLSAQLPGWESNANKNTAVFRNRPANNNYYYNCPDLLNRVVLWIGDVNKDAGQTTGYMERSLVFPRAGVYSVDVEYAVGLTYQHANTPRFLVSIGDKTQEVVGTRQIGDLQKGHLLFSVQAGSGTIRLTATPGLGTAENAAAVVIASLKVTLVKEIGIEIGDIVAPDDNAQTGQAADAKATYEQLAGKASKVDATLTPKYSDTPTFSEWTFSDGGTHAISPVVDGADGWYFLIDNSSPSEPPFNTKDEAETSLVLEFPYVGITATRVRTDIIGYTLGSQTDKPVASEAEAEALRTALTAKANCAANPTAGNLAALDEQGNPTDSQIPAANVATKGEIRYDLVTKTISNNAVTLDDRAYNYVDARTLGSSDSLDIDFPALVDGKSRDFVFAVECGANPPAISYAAFVTIMADDASSLTPEEGMNIYAFKEFKTNMFLASRKLITTVVDNSPENGDQLLLAMQKRGIDTTNITDFGGVESALGLSDSATLQDAIDAVMN